MSDKPDYGIKTPTHSDFLRPVTPDEVSNAILDSPPPSPSAPDPTRLSPPPSPGSSTPDPTRLSPFRAFDFESIVMRLSQFTSTGEKSSGTSSSEPMLGSGGVIYQVKRSNSTKPERSLVGLDRDPSDSIGEFFASVYAKEIAPLIYGVDAAGSRELSPEVKLVIDEKGLEVRLASKYLNMVPKVTGETPEQESTRTRFQGVTLDQVLAGKPGAPQGQKGKLVHPILEATRKPATSDEDLSKTLSDEELSKTLFMGSPFSCTAFKDRDGSTPEITLDKKQLYQSLKMSLLLGDHDVNPGNLFVVYDKDTKKTNICRIDYGHAFNDLIKKWALGDHSPSLGEGRGCVLDALNREDINGGQSKFKRDYRGVIPDIDFANVLREGGEELDAKLAVAQAKCHEGIEALIGSKDNTIHKTIVLSTKKALQTLCFRMGAGKQTEEDAPSVAISESTKFISKNAEEMKSVANLIEIQSLVEEVGKGTKPPKEVAERIKALYQEDKKYLEGKNSASKVEWVTMDGDKSPKKCSLGQYIESRKTPDNNEAALSSLIKETNTQFKGIEPLTPLASATRARAPLTPASIVLAMKTPFSRDRSSTEALGSGVTTSPMQTPKSRPRGGTEVTSIKVR